MVSQPATTDSTISSNSPSGTHQNAARPLPEKPSSYPIPIFFYGTLMLPHILKQVLRLDEDTQPTLCSAQVLDHNIKLWGPYPALVKTDTEGVIGPMGMIYTLEEEQHLRRLEFYEGVNYKLGTCNVLKEGEARPISCYTFLWDGRSKDLREGVFDATGFTKW